MNSNENGIGRLQIDQTISFEELKATFGCSGQGGMQRVRATNSLIVISNHTKGLYHDRWVDDVFHYTGMGQTGDQSLDYLQNRTLSQSPSNGVTIYVFEVFLSNNYVYRGVFELSGQPYFESQPGSDGVVRQACVFPLVRVGGGRATYTEEQIDRINRKSFSDFNGLSNEELERKAKLSGKKKPSSKDVVRKEYDRDKSVIAYAKRRANGVCQLCENPAPFSNKKKEPYLETHHLVWLSQGGSDTVDNTVALCPNCHRRMHIVKSKRDINFLRKKISM